MSKRFYIILFCVLSVSVVLLGFSFSKESGTNDLVALTETIDKEFRVIYSNNKRIDTKENSIVNISLINKNEEISKFYLVLEEVNNNTYDSVYYSIDGAEKKELINNIIYLGELNSYGKDGDQKFYSIELISHKDENIEFKLNVIKEDIRTFEDKMMFDINVYKDRNNNYRYYGEEVNNYIKYEEKVCRVIGIVDNKLKIVCEPELLGTHNTEIGKYVSKDDLLASCSKNIDVQDYDILDYNSWMMSDKNYWLEETDLDSAYYFSINDGIKTMPRNMVLYTRYVYELDSQMMFNGGDGTKNNPYEVSYGS